MARSICYVKLNGLGLSCSLEAVLVKINTEFSPYLVTKNKTAMNTNRICNPLRVTLRQSALALAATAGLAIGSAQALTFSLTGNGPNGYSEYGGEADGYKFTTGDAILLVSWLGFYDAPNGESGTLGDDLLASHRVSIWRESDGVLMAQTTVVPGDSLEGNFRGRNVTPVHLAANTAYVIAADYGGGDRMQEGNDLTGWGLNGISIQAGDGRWGGAGGGMPNNGWQLMIGANFGYTLAPLTVTLTTPADTQAYPTGTSITATANVVEPGAFTDTVTFHTTPIAPAGPTIDTLSTDTGSPFSADFGVLPPGTYQIYATVANNNVPPDTATSATHTFTVAAAIPTTTVLAPAGPATTYGQNVTFTATVSPVPTGGTLQFLDGGNSLGAPVAVNTITGEATYSSTVVSAGTREITAQYSGHWLHEPSTTAASISQEVGQAQLTVKALNTLRAPNTANPDPFPYQITGYQNGENLASSGVTGTPALSTDAVLASPAGDYTVTCALGTLAATNYSFAFVNGTLTVADVADTFSVNFYAYPGWMTDEQQRANIRVPEGVPAGLPGWYTSGWKNVAVPFGMDSPLPAEPLTSNKGSSATFIFKDCRNGWVYDGARTVGLGDGNYNMMDGHVNSTLDGASNKFDMEVTGIPFALYDVIFYMGANLPQYGDGTGIIKFNGAADRAFTVKPGAFDGTFTEMVDGVTPGNYIVFTGVTGSSFTTQTWGTGENGFNHVGPFGFQIREVTIASGYTAWANANGAAGQTADQDHDSDGVENGIEYFMGQTGSSFTTMPGLDGSNMITWPMDPAYNGTYEVQTSPDLGTWTNVDPRPTPSGGNLSYSLPPGLGKQFVRLLVTPSP